MKTTYLINKEQPDGSIRLTVSTSSEWLAVVKANRQLPPNRQRYFILDYIVDGGEMDRMVIEASAEAYRVWHREHMAAQRNRAAGKDFLVLSTDASLFDDGEMECLLNTLAGTSKVEEDACDHILLEQLRAELAQWKPWANDMLDLYLLGDKRHGTEALTEKYSVSPQVIRKYKRQFEEFVKKFIQGVSF